MHRDNTTDLSRVAFRANGAKGATVLDVEMTGTALHGEPPFVGWAYGSAMVELGDIECHGFRAGRKGTDLHGVSSQCKGAQHVGGCTISATQEAGS